jgi:hypothetical protein
LTEPNLTHLMTRSVQRIRGVTNFQQIIQYHLNGAGIDIFISEMILYRIIIGLPFSRSTVKLQI